MEIAKVAGEAREPRGSKANVRLRKRGMVPAVIYGHGETPETVSLSRHDLELALDHMAHVIEIDVNGKTETYLIKDVQFDTFQKDPLHLDLMRFSRDEQVEASVAVEVKGEAPGLSEDGVLVQSLNELTVQCGALEIPEVITVHVGELHLNDTLTIGQLDLPSGVKPMHEEDEVVVAIRPKRAEEEVEETPEAEIEGEAGEPEVIKRGGEEDEGAGEEES